MSKTFTEIVEVLKSKISVEDFALGVFDEEDTLGLGEITEVHQYGGEGQGDHWESVKHFKDHDVYISVTGRHSSYWGTDFSNWDDTYNGVREVVPKQKTIIVYESK